jgi:hypothetical protein
MDFVNQQPIQPEGYVTVKSNATLSFCERFYYDLYTVADNNVPCRSIVDLVIFRRKETLCKKSCSVD